MSDIDDSAIQLADEHAARIGHIAIGSNIVHSMVFAMFQSASGLEWEIARAIFFSLRADSAQREITIATIRARLLLPEEAETAEKAITLINQAGTLSGERNAFIHTLWQFRPETQTFEPPMDLPFHKSLQADRHKEQAVDLRKRLGDLVEPFIRASFAIALSPSVQKLRAQKGERHD